MNTIQVRLRRGSFVSKKIRCNSNILPAQSKTISFREIWTCQIEKEKKMHFAPPVFQWVIIDSSKRVMDSRYSFVYVRVRGLCARFYLHATAAVLSGLPICMHIAETWKLQTVAMHGPGVNFDRAWLVTRKRRAEFGAMSVLWWKYAVKLIFDT
jgi:hypothetical protein